MQRHSLLVSRRSFVGTLATAAGAAGLHLLGSAEAAAQDRPKTLVGSNIYGWTQYADRDKKALDVSEVISALRDCGYDYLESWMNVERPEENARFAEQLRSKGLQPVSLYTGARLHEAGKWEETVARILKAAKVCRQAGFEVISCNPDPIGREKTDAELQVQTQALTGLGAGLNALGMRLGVHHHLPEMVNGAREFHYNFRHTSAGVVGFCYDVHWVWKGGVASAEALRLYGERVVTWHLRQSRGGVWWEDLDTGDVDFGEVAEIARRQGFPRRFTVELALESGTKVTRTVVENHRRSREFVRKVFEFGAA